MLVQLLEEVASPVNKEMRIRLNLLNNRDAYPVNEEAAYPVNEEAAHPVSLLLSSTETTKNNVVLVLVFVIRGSMFLCQTLRISFYNKLSNNLYDENDKTTISC
ncbi:hypothetical protein Tco_0254241 [Tanacetum coccineum]